MRARTNRSQGPKGLQVLLFYKAVDCSPDGSVVLPEMLHQGLDTNPPYGQKLIAWMVKRPHDEHEAPPDSTRCRALKSTTRAVTM